MEDPSRSTDIRAAPDWEVILPGKRLFESKARLSADFPGAGPVLAKAMLADSLDALSASRSVRRVIVVTSDRVLARLASSYGAMVVPDPDTVLSDSLEAGLLRTRRESSRVAYFVADLPCFVPRVVDLLLEKAGAIRHAFVPDAALRNVTVLATTRKGGLPPRFGGPLDEYHALGARAVGLDLPAARRDVDTWNDISSARDLGMGRHTDQAVQCLLSKAPRSRLDLTTGTRSADARQKSSSDGSVTTPRARQ